MTVSPEIKIDQASYQRYLDGLTSALQTVLGTDEVTAETSIFEAGGASMHAEIYARTASVALGKAITFTDVFLFPSPVTLARELAERKANSNPSAPTRVNRDPADWHPVSENQAARLERLRVVERTGRDLLSSESEVVITGVELTGPLDVSAMTDAIATIVERTTALRTIFDWTGEGTPRQRAAPPSFGLDILDATHLHPIEVQELVRRPLQLDSGQLARFLLASSQPDRHQLWATFEHLTSDGVSCGIMLDKIAATYSALVEGGTLPTDPPAVDIDGYEFGYLETEFCEGEQGQEAERYWLTMIGEGPVWRSFQHPHIAPAREDHAGSDLLLLRLVPSRIGELLGRRAGQLNTTVHGLTAFALARAVAEASGDRDVSIYWHVSNRSLPEVASTVGSLAATTMVRVPSVPRDQSVDSIQAVTGAVASSMAQAFYPLDRLARMHRPDDRLMPDDRPLLYLYVNPPPGPERGPDTRFAGLIATPADRCGQRGPRGYTLDASIRYTKDAFAVGIAMREGMLPVEDLQVMLDVFAEELIALVEIAEDHSADSELKEVSR